MYVDLRNQPAMTGANKRAPQVYRELKLNLGGKPKITIAFNPILQKQNSPNQP